MTAGVKSQEVRAETGSPGKQNWLGQVLLVLQCVVLLDKLCEREEWGARMRVCGVSGASEFKNHNRHQPHPGETEPI